MEENNIEERKQERKFTIKGPIECRIEMLDNENRGNKPLLHMSTAMATLTSLLIISQIALGEPIEIVQCTGTAIAMTAYAIGYNKKTKLNTDEKTKLLEAKEKETLNIDYLVGRLALLKHNLAKFKVSRAMNFAAGTGFIINSISHIIEYINNPTNGNLLGSFFLAALSGVVAVLDYTAVVSYHKTIKATVAEISSLEEPEIEKAEEVKKTKVNKKIKK